jgi:ASCH domain.
MKAISLLQPWATLVAIGAKRIETRSWPTNYRGPLAIHASKGFSRQQKEICWSEPFRSTLLNAGYRLSFSNLEFGLILARVELIDCMLINSAEKPPEPELSFGDYTPGRYAWLLSDVQAYEVPIPAIGHLGLWEFEW